METSGVRFLNTRVINKNIPCCTQDSIRPSPLLAFIALLLYTGSVHRTDIRLFAAVGVLRTGPYHDTTQYYTDDTTTTTTSTTTTTTAATTTTTTTTTATTTNTAYSS